MYSTPTAQNTSLSPVSVVRRVDSSLLRGLVNVTLLESQLTEGNEVFHSEIRIPCPCDTWKIPVHVIPVHVKPENHLETHLPHCSYCIDWVLRYCVCPPQKNSTKFPCATRAGVKGCALYIHWAHTCWSNVVFTSFQGKDVELTCNRRWIDIGAQWVRNIMPLLSQCCRLHCETGTNIRYQHCVRARHVGFWEYENILIHVTEGERG